MIRTPTAPIFASPTHTPGYPGRRAASSIPQSPSVSITTCSTACTWSRDRGTAHRHVDDRVADELAGPVVRDVAAAIRAHERRAHALGIDEHVLGPRAHAERVHVRVLEQEQPRLPASRVQLVLQLEGTRVLDHPESADVECGAHCSTGVRGERVPRPQLVCQRDLEQPDGGTNRRSEERARHERADEPVVEGVDVDAVEQLVLDEERDGDEHEGHPEVRPDEVRAPPERGPHAELLGHDHRSDEPEDREHDETGDHEGERGDPGRRAPGGGRRPGGG